MGALFLSTMTFLEELNLNSFYGRHFTYEAYTLLLLYVGINEYRYVLQKFPWPKLTWYYDAFFCHELKQTYLGWFDSIEENSRKFLAETKEQLDYYLIHKEYLFVKKRVLSQYLENERQSLSKHFNERTILMLNNIKSLENANIKNEISKVAEESLNTVLQTVKDNTKNQEILKSSFESALEGLRQGKMEYKGDKVVPLFLSELEKRSSVLTNLSQEEENKRFALTDKQKQYLIDVDTRSKKDYLGKSPEVGTALKNSDSYKAIVQRIKSRVEH